MKTKLSILRLLIFTFIIFGVYGCANSEKTTQEIPTHHLPPDTPIPLTSTPTKTITPKPTSSPTPSTGKIVGVVDASYGGTSILLAQVHEIKNSDTISITMNSENILPNALGEFAFEDVPPGQYVMINDILIIGLVSSKEELKADAGPFTFIDYFEAKDSNVGSFVFLMKDGSPGGGFLYSDSDVIIFSVEAGQTLTIEKPIEY